MTLAIAIPLTEEDLKAAAHLCLEAGAMVDYDNCIPPGAGRIQSHNHHERKRRFENALEKLQGGATSLTDLGLWHVDCQWAAGKAERIKDELRDDWVLHFQTAEREIKEFLGMGQH